MKTNKAVITAAGPDQTHLPLQSIVTPDGQTTTVASLLLDELFAAGMETVAIVIAPGSERDFTAAIPDHRSQVTFIEQPEPLGYGHAVLQAREFVGGDSFLLMMGDHLYLSLGEKSCIAQLLAIASQANSPVSAVQPTHESKLPLYGTIGGTRISGRPGIHEVRKVLEKPTPTVAEQELLTPGLRAGHYLCFFGMHVLTPAIMSALEEQPKATKETPLTLTPALDQLANQEDYLAAEIDGLRFNIGEPYGLLRSQLGMALAGENRDEVMSSIIELLAQTRP